jgi:Leucine-rich repeat (LRR) protein
LIPLNYFFDSIALQTSFLNIINFQDCKMNDKNFLDFFYYLGKKKYLQESIQYLSFSGNELTYINLKKFMNSGGNLKNLQYFDLSKNNIYEFVTDNFKTMPTLKILDLSDNNISNYSFFNTIYSLHKKKKMTCGVLLCNNLFVTNNRYNNRNYRKYIYDILSDFKYKIKKVNLSLLYNKDNIEELIKLRISPYVKISMVKLNLSFCGLKTETIWKFFQNNFGLLNLVSLNLSYNFISNSFFSLCAGQDILLEKLKIIDISKNEICCKTADDFQKIEIFINNYQKLKKIKIQKNDFIEELINIYQKQKEEINSIIEKIKKKEILFFVDTKYKDLITDKLIDIIDYKDKI